MVCKLVILCWVEVGAAVLGCSGWVWSRVVQWCATQCSRVRQCWWQELAAVWQHAWYCVVVAMWSSGMSCWAHPDA